MDLTHRPAKLCILSKWTPHFEGYGFDLMTKKSGEGHYISMLHEGGPAEATNLEAGDWLIEVNGINVERFTHAEVIKLIKDSENGSVRLLLAPSETDKWRKRNQVIITSSHPDLVHYITPPYQGKLRSFINGALDRLVNVKKNEQIGDEPSVYHRYSLPIPSGMSTDLGVGDWSSALEKSFNDQAESIRGAEVNGQLVGSLDEQRKREIADWRDKSLEMLMKNRADVVIDDNPSEVYNQRESVNRNMSIVSTEGDEDNIQINERPISSNQEQVLADIHLTDNISNKDNNSDDNDDNGHVNCNTNNSNGYVEDDNRHVTTITLLDGEFYARQCRIKKSSETSDYGFKMDSLPSGGGHFLRLIEPNGPAGLSGTQNNDRLIEVNHVNVEYVDHDTVVNMIRKSPDCEVTLLLVDEKSYKWFKSRNIRIHHNTGGSLIRYCDHRGSREIGHKLERPVSMIEVNKRNQLYRRGLSFQSTIGNERLVETTNDTEINSQGRQGDQVELRHSDNGEGANQPDIKPTGQSLVTEAATGDKQSTMATSESTKTDQQEESRSSSIIDWFYGPVNDVDRLNRGKTIIKVPDDAPRPRLCSITKDPDGVFGFTLNTYEKGRIKLIAEVDRGSSAEAAGLLQWDRVIEVNGVNINIENHAQVTGRIEASGNRLHLLLLPEAQYEWYERAGLVPRSNQSNVIYLSNTDVTRDSITIARSLENAVTVNDKKTTIKSKHKSLQRLSSTSSSITATRPISTMSTTTTTKPTTESTSNNQMKMPTISDNGDKQSTVETRKGDQINQQPFQSNVVPATINSNIIINERNDVNQSNRNSTISQNIQYNTIDEETSEAIYDHREAREVSTLPMRKGKKQSFTKRIFKRSLFGSSSKKDRLSSSGGSLSNLSSKSDNNTIESSSYSERFADGASRTSTVTLKNTLDEDEEEYRLADQADEEVVTVVMVKKETQETNWSTNNNNNNDNLKDLHNNNNGFGDQSYDLTMARDEPDHNGQDDDHLLEKLKTLSLRDIRQTTRSESKIQAYQRMSQLNFSQRIKHFENL